MLVLINSTVGQAGVSTMAQAIAFTYSNWINRPALLVSLKTDKFYKKKCMVKDEFESKFLSIVNGNTGGHGDLKNYAYKINDLLYYYQAHSSDLVKDQQRLLDLKLYLERASREFGMVVLDVDDELASFQKYLDIADVCFNVVPPDKMIMEETRDIINNALEEYKESGGLAVKTKMCYIVNRIDGGMTKGAACKALGASQRDVYTIPYDKRFILEGNNNRLMHFISETLLYKKTPNDKVLEISFKRMYEMLRKA